MDDYYFLYLNVMFKCLGEFIRVYNHGQNQGMWVSSTCLISLVKDVMLLKYSNRYIFYKQVKIGKKDGKLHYKILI